MVDHHAQKNMDHTVLIVDDEVHIGKLLARLLKQISVKTVYAPDGMEALAKIEKRKNPFSLIISDQKMPGMKGTELLEKVSLLSPSTIRFLTTGYSDFDTVIQAVNQGKIHKYLQKPWDPDRVVDIIKEGLEQYELTLEYENLFRTAKEQNAKLSEFNALLRQKTQKQAQILNALDEKLKKAGNEAGTCSAGTREEALSGAKKLKETLKDRKIVSEAQLNLLFAAAVADLYCRFQEIAFKKGFEILPDSSRG
ncbi:response regulator [Desulfobacter latus]|uniref:Response regulator n=1 Tax=Desulfobacter latus TaxID=2292 RepID=A0A850TEG0_9BACT|nr:response regulator [Desulfobacter latus]NWH06677.1 response regulator [Desulfobacter latus]